MPTFSTFGLIDRNDERGGPVSRHSSCRGPVDPCEHASHNRSRRFEFKVKRRARGASAGAEGHPHHFAKPQPQRRRPGALPVPQSRGGGQQAWCGPFLASLVSARIEADNPRQLSDSTDPTDSILALTSLALRRAQAPHLHSCSTCTCSIYSRAISVRLIFCIL